MVISPRLNGVYSSDNPDIVLDDLKAVKENAGKKWKVGRRN
jgi:hypothetical protein